MKYFKCCKCENLYSFPSQPSVQLMQCGAFVGFNPDNVAVGCGGKMIEISEDTANLIVDSMR